MTKKRSGEMSFLDHLEELRWHLIRSVVVVMVVAVVAFFMKEFIFDVIIFGPKNPDFLTYKLFCDLSRYFGSDESFCLKELPFRIQSRTMAGQFSAHIWTSIWAGVIVGFPYLVYELWRFVSPGLFENEKRNAKGFILVSSLLFFMGVSFGYYIICPLSVNFLGTYSVSKEIYNDIDLDSYISIIRSSVISCGLIFELPIIIYFFTKIGLVTPQFMRKYRKHAFVLILILAAIITPPDVASQIVVSLPIVVLYEVSIFISYLVLRRQAKKSLKL